MITKIELTNYRCYAKHTEVFSSGLNIIAGANGIGKTSIVEAISFALFGNKVTRGKANSWVKQGTKHGKVALYIDDYIIHRGDNEQLVESKDGTILARQHSGIDEWITKTYGLTYDLYSTSNYIAQKDIESFSALQPADRIKRVEKLLKIDKLDILKDKIKLKLKEVNNSINLYTNKLANAIVDTKALKKAKAELKKKHREYDTINKSYHEALISQGAYDQQLVAWNKKKDI